MLAQDKSTWIPFSKMPKPGVAVYTVISVVRRRDRNLLRSGSSFSYKGNGGQPRLYETLSTNNKIKEKV